MSFKNELFLHLHFNKYIIFEDFHWLAVTKDKLTIYYTANAVI